MTKEAKIQNEEKTASIDVEKLDSYTQKKQTGLLSHIIHKTKLRMSKTRNHKTPRSKHRKYAV